MGFSGEETGDRRPGNRPGPPFWLTPLSCLLVPLVLALPVFAHGCHTGDHDDEPSAAPQSLEPEAPR